MTRVCHDLLVPGQIRVHVPKAGTQERGLSPEQIGSCYSSTL